MFGAPCNRHNPSAKNLPFLRAKLLIPGAVRERGRERFQLGREFATDIRAKASEHQGDERSERRPPQTALSADGLAFRLTPHRPEARAILGNLVLDHHLEAIPPIEGQVPLLHRLEVAEQSLRVGASQDRLEETAADALALTRRIDAEAHEVPVRRGNVAFVQRLDAGHDVHEPAEWSPAEPQGRRDHARPHHAERRERRTAWRQPHRAALDAVAGGVDVAVLVTVVRNRAHEPRDLALARRFVRDHVDRHRVVEESPAEHFADVVKLVRLETGNSSFGRHGYTSLSSRRSAGSILALSARESTSCPSCPAPVVTKYSASLNSLDLFHHSGSRRGQTRQMLCHHEAPASRWIHLGNRR